MQGHGINLTGRPLKSLFPPKKNPKRRTGRMTPMDTLSSSPLRSSEQSYTQPTTPVRIVVPDERPPRTKRLDLTGDSSKERVLEPVALEYIKLNGDKLKISYSGLSMSVQGGSLVFRSPKPHNFYLEILLDDVSTVLVDEGKHATNFVLKLIMPAPVTAGERNEKADSLWIFGKDNTEEELEQFYTIIKETNPHRVKYVSAEELRAPFPGLTPISKKDFYGDSSPSTPLRRSTRAHNPDLSVAEKINLLDRIGTPTKRGKPAIPDWHEDIPVSKQLVYDPPLRFKFDDSSTFTVTNSDFKCLYNNFWINDTIIDFFLKYDLQRSIKEQKQISKYRVKLLNSYFYTKLASSEDCYENVKSWFKNEDDLFMNDLIVIPIVHNFHWLCVLVTGTKIMMNSARSTNIAEQTDDETDSRQSVMMTVLDSLGGDRYPFMAPLRRFFIGYAQDKYNMELMPRDLKTKKLAVPRQRNFNDCGIHVIYNARRVFQDYEGFLELIRQSYRKAGKKLDRDFFSRDELIKLRPRLRNQLLEFLKIQVTNEGGDASTIGILNNSDWKQKNKDTSLNDAAYEDDDDLQIIEEPAFQKNASREGSAEPLGKQDASDHLQYEIPPSSPPKEYPIASKSEAGSPMPMNKPETSDEIVIRTQSTDDTQKRSHSFKNHTIDLEQSIDDLREDSEPVEQTSNKASNPRSIELRDMEVSQEVVESINDTHGPVDIPGARNSKASIINVDDPAARTASDFSHRTQELKHDLTGFSKKRSTAYEGIKTRKRRLKADTQLIIKGHFDI